MSYKIDEIEGIGPTFGAKLREAGIETTDDLLETCCGPAGRRKIAEQTGLREDQILGWANMADLMRIKGVGRQFAELLEATGVDTVKELRNRNPQNLATAIEVTNENKKLARATPSESAVEEWVETAKSIEPKITH